VIEGVRDDGHSTSRHGVAELEVSTGGRLGYIEVCYGQGRCSDCERFFSGYRSDRGLPAVPATGAVAFTRGGPGHVDLHRKRVDGHESFAVTLRFTGQRMTGTVVDRFATRSVRCDSGTVHFTAWEDGTTEAPVRTATAETGTYASANRAATAVV
jgi:hypothetical protein